MEILGYIIWALGALFCGINFYTSFVRYPLHILLGRSKESFQWVSGVPVLGTLFIVVAFVLLRENAFFFWSSIILLLVDTGGPLRFSGSLLYQKFRA
jgi:hypothetical protein